MPAAFLGCCSRSRDLPPTSTWKNTEETIPRINVNFNKRSRSSSTIVPTFLTSGAVISTRFSCLQYNNYKNNKVSTSYDLIAKLEALKHSNTQQQEQKREVRATRALKHSPATTAAELRCFFICSRFDCEVGSIRTLTSNNSIDTGNGAETTPAPLQQRSRTRRVPKFVFQKGAKVRL